MENGIFWSEIGSGFGKAGSTPLPIIPRSTSPPPPPGFLVHDKLFKVRANHYPADVTVERDHLEHLTGVAVFKNINCVLQSLNGTQLCSKT